MTNSRTRTVLAAAVLAASLGGAGIAGAATTKTITMKNISLTPAKLTVAKGSTVRWAWKDGTIRHDVNWKNGGFKASALQSRALKPYSITFKKAGTYRYFCSVHPGDMQGKVVVR
jgi:plastocyanin